MSNAITKVSMLSPGNANRFAKCQNGELSCQTVAQIHFRSKFLGKMEEISSKTLQMLTLQKHFRLIFNIFHGRIYIFNAKSWEKVITSVRTCHYNKRIPFVYPENVWLSK